MDFYLAFFSNVIDWAFGQVEISEFLKTVLVKQRLKSASIFYIVADYAVPEECLIQISQ